VEERLEHMAIGEVLARHYRHSSMLDGVAKAGASWGQVGAARGTSAEQARCEYRQWAEGQHDMWASTGVWNGEPAHRFGMNDSDYAAAMRYASMPTERERRAEELARAERIRHAEMVRDADAAGIPLLDDIPACGDHARPGTQRSIEAGR
jgi:hypothetical protein